MAVASKISFDPNATLGSSGLKSSGGLIDEEFLSQLKGSRAAKVYREIRDNDPTIGAAFNAIDTLVRQVPWSVIAADDSQEAAKYKALVDTCLLDLSHTWADFISEVFSKLTFGWSYLEIVYRVRKHDQKSKYNDGAIGWRKFSLRGQESLSRWEMQSDGGISGMWQSTASGMFFIPIEKALLFRTATIKNNPEGRSLLRNVYKPYYFLKRLQEIEAIGFERNLAGMPVMRVPPSIMAKDATGDRLTTRSLFERIVQEVRTDEHMGLVLPSKIDPTTGKDTGFDFELLSTGGRDQASVGEAIMRYTHEIAAAINANFISLGRDGAGSMALDRSKTNFFVLTLNSLLDSVQDVFNRFAIDRLMDLNKVPAELRPRIEHGEILSAGITELATFLSQLSQYIPRTNDLSNELLRRANLPVLPVEEGAKTDQIFNGAQIEQASFIVSQVHQKIVPAESGINMLINLLNIPEQAARAMIGEVDPSVVGGDLDA